MKDVIILIKNNAVVTCTKLIWIKTYVEDASDFHMANPKHMLLTESTRRLSLMLQNIYFKSSVG